MLEVFVHIVLHLLRHGVVSVEVLDRCFEQVVLEQFFGVLIKLLEFYHHQTKVVHQNGCAQHPKKHDH